MAKTFAPALRKIYGRTSVAIFSDVHWGGAFKGELAAALKVHPWTQCQPSVSPPAVTAIYTKVLVIMSDSCVTITSLPLGMTTRLQQPD